MENLPSLRQLQYFIAITETNSFSRAAERCNVTQPTLSGALRDLEALLGQKLFDRSSRNVALTRAGEELLRPAKDLVSQAEQMIELARSHHSPLSGGLRLGVIPTIAPYVLPQLLPALKKHYAALDLTLKEEQTGRLLKALELREIDAALMAFPYATPGAEQMILWSEPFVIAMPGTKPLDPRPAQIHDLNTHNIMLLEDGHCLREHAIAACRLQPQAQRQTFGATSLPTLLQMVQHGFGATLLPAMAVDAKNPPRGITIRHFAAPQPSRQIGLAWRKDSPRAEEYRMLGKFIVKTLHPR